MAILVTGGGGFLGKALVRQLVANGKQVKIYCRGDYPELSRMGVEVVRGDLRDRQKTMAVCKDVETLFHAAALPGIGCRWEPYYETNTLGTQHIIEGSLQHGVRKLIYTSSPSVTFDGSPQENVDETASYPTEWLAHYPHSKALAEKAVLEANGQKGLLTCALRPHLIWGPGDQHLIPRLLQRAQQGRLRRVGDGSNLIDMVYVDNAALAHLQAEAALEEKSPVAGSAYFITQGEPVYCWEWIDQILGLAGLPPVKKEISFSAAWRLGSVLETVYGALRLKSEPPMTRFLAAQLAMHHYFDISRAENDFGYSPEISTEDGMRRLGAWIHENRDDG